MTMPHTHLRGFTLIELSIVLVIIGLVVGGVLVGRDLIAAAEVRATLTQLTKYNTAVNVFRDKYGYLPGDIPDPTASNFGLMPRGPYDGMGDGNGILAGNSIISVGGSSGSDEGAGETVLFWADLSTANLIDGHFASASASAMPSLGNSPAVFDLYFPKAKLGGGNYFYAWSGGIGSAAALGDNTNYFGLANINDMGSISTVDDFSEVGLSVSQTHAIDLKLDDGLPQSGRVMAVRIAFGPAWAAGLGSEGAFDATTHGATTAATPGSSTTCYDNSADATGATGVAGLPQHYSMEISAGSRINCALSFRFQ